MVGTIKPPVHRSQQRAGKGSPPREQSCEQFILSPWPEETWYEIRLCIIMESEHGSLAGFSGAQKRTGVNLRKVGRGI